MTARTPRIRIEDLSPLETLTEQEMAEIYGAGRKKKWEFSGQAMEVLEVRQVMSAVTVAFDGNTAKITGSSASDAVFVKQDSGKTYVESSSGHGLSRTELPDSIGRLHFDLGAGDDFIQIADAFWESGLTIDSGDGADVLVRGTGVASKSLTAETIDRLFVVEEQLPAGVVNSLVRQDVDGNTIELTYRAGQLVSAVTTNITGITSTVSWSLDGSVSRRTLNGTSPQLEELWTPGGGYRRTDWDSDGNVVTRSFLNEDLLQEEKWETTTFTRTTWSGDGSRLQQKFQNDVLVREELATKSGETIVTEHRNDGSVARESYLNEKLRVSDVVSAEVRIRTAWAENGIVIRQTFAKDQQTLEETWTSEGGFRRVAFISADKRVTEYFRNELLVQKDETDGTKLTRTARDASGASLRQVYEKDVLIVEEQWGTNKTHSRKTWNSDGSSVRESLENGVLRLREEWRGTTAIRVGWGTDGSTLKQIWVNGRQTTEEVKDANKGARVTTWNSDGSIVRQTFQDGKEVLREEWHSGKRYSRVASSASADRYQESFVDGKQVSKEQWNSKGGYQTTSWTPTETMRLTYQDKILRLRERWSGKSLTSESWDGTGNWMTETFAEGKLLTRQQGTKDGSAVHQTYSSAGTLTREEKWGKDRSRQITSWSSTSTTRETYSENSLLLREVWEGNTQTRQTWDGKGNSGKLTWSGGKLTRDEKWTSAGVYHVTNWYSASTVRQTIISGIERLRDTWQGSTTTRQGWDGKGNSIRQVWSNGKQTSEEIWDSSGGYRRTTWYGDKSVWRQYFLNSREAFRQTWSSSGAYRASTWSVPAGSGQYRGLSTPDSIRLKSDSLSSDVAAEHAKIATTSAAVSVSGATEAADTVSRKIAAVTDNSALISRATKALNADAFEQLKAIGRDWPSFSSVILPWSEPTPGTVHAASMEAFAGIDAVTFNTDQLLHALKQFDPVAVETGTYLQQQELKSIEESAKSIRAAIEALQVGRFPELTAQLDALEASASAQVQPMIAELRRSLMDAMKLTEESAQQSKEWSDAVTIRLAESSKELTTQQEALEKIVREYNAALAIVKKEQDPDRNLRSQSTTDSTKASTQLGGRGGLGGYIGGNKTTPEYIDPNAPEHNLPGRIKVVYDKVLVITQQLRSSLKSLLEGSDRGLAAELESIIQGLDAGKAAYVDQTKSASTLFSEETSRVSSVTKNEKARVTSQSEDQIEAAVKSAALAVATYEKSQKSLQESQQTQIDAAAALRDKVVGLNAGFARTPEVVTALRAVD